MRGENTLEQNHRDKVAKVVALLLPPLLLLVVVLTRSVVVEIAYVQSHAVVKLQERIPLVHCDPGVLRVFPEKF